MFRIGGVLIGGNNLIRASALQKVGGYNTAIVFYGEDTDTAKRISKTGKIIFAKEIVMKTSVRRFKNEGTLRISINYLYHFCKATFFSRISGAKIRRAD